jgi:hypothetical protein
LIDVLLSQNGILFALDSSKPWRNVREIALRGGARKAFENPSLRVPKAETGGCSLRPDANRDLVGVMAIGVTEPECFFLAQPFGSLTGVTS